MSLPLGSGEVREYSLLLSVVFLLAKSIYDLIRRRTFTDGQARVLERVNAMGKSIEGERLALAKTLETERKELRDEQETVRARLHQVSNDIHGVSLRVAVVETRGADTAQRLDRMERALELIGTKIDRLLEAR